QAVGVATLRATSGAVTSAPATVTVFAPVAIATIEIDPLATMLILDSLHFTARALDSSGQEAGGVDVTWESSNEQIARVAETGAIVAQSAGSVMITASAGGVTSDPMPLEVRTGFWRDYDLSNWLPYWMCDRPCWTSDGIEGGTTSIDPSNGDRNAVSLAYDVNLGAMSAGVSLRTTTFSAVATGTGTVSFDWVYSGFHAFFQTTAELTAFAETGTGATTTNTLVAGGTPVGGGFTVSGSATVEVVAGRRFGIIVGGSNRDANGTVQGQVQLQGITGPVGGAPGFVGDRREAAFSYDIDLGEPGPGVSRRTATFAMVAPRSGPVSFDWTYTGFHAFQNVNAELTLFADINIGQPQTTRMTSPLVDRTAGGNSFTFSGSATIDVEAGALFGITVGGRNQDTNSKLQGTVTITKFGGS
ncbi:MAG: Ig-like domain-containing protein, partial [Longimicrobiales bacterium]